jgi:2-polyprenyl-3-methyl-5-hydroxy-6-metoxy-1,4-benzoquinol methylase
MSGSPQPASAVSGRDRPDAAVAPPDDAADESARLEHVAGWYSSQTGFYGKLVRYGFLSLRPHFRGDTCLELGPADGQMTGMLLEAFHRVTSVDGSATFCDRLRERFAGEERHEVACALFEDYEPAERFDVVLGTHILEHLEDPVATLARTRDWLRPDGRVIMLVPNALSIHRVVAVEMGLLSAPDALNDLDRQLGHRRVYTPQLLRSHLEAAGLGVEATGGNFLKPLSNGQIEQWFDDRMLDGFWRAGRRYPEHAAEIFAVCTPA